MLGRADQASTKHSDIRRQRKTKAAGSSSSSAGAAVAGAAVNQAAVEEQQQQTQQQKQHRQHISASMKSYVILLLLLGFCKSFTNAGRSLTPALAPSETHVRASPGSHVPQNPWTPRGTAPQTPTPVPQKQHVQEPAGEKAPAPAPQQRTDPISNLLNAIPQIFGASASSSGASAASNQQTDRAAPSSASQSQQQRPNKATPARSSSNAHGANRSPNVGPQSFKSRPMMPLRLPPLDDLFPADPLGLLGDQPGPSGKDATSLRQKSAADEGPSDLPPLFPKPPDLFDDLYAGQGEQSFKEQVPMPDPLPVPDAVLEAAADGDPFPLPDPLDDSTSGPAPDAPEQESSAKQSSETRPRPASPSGPAGDAGSSADPSTTSFQSQGGGFLPSLPELLGLPGSNSGGQQLPTNVLPQISRFPAIPRFRPLSLFPGLEPDDDGEDLEPIGRSRSSDLETSRLATRTTPATPSSTKSSPSAKPSPNVRVIRVRRRRPAPSQGPAAAHPPAPAQATAAVPVPAAGPIRAEPPQAAPASLPLVSQARPAGPARARSEPDAPTAEFAGGTRTPHAANSDPASADAGSGPSPAGVPTSFHQVASSEGIEDKDLLAALGSDVDAGPTATADASAVHALHQSMLQTPGETGTTGEAADQAQAALGETLADVLGAALVEGTHGATPPSTDAGASPRAETTSASGASTQRPVSIPALAPAPTVPTAVPRASLNLSLQEKRTPKVEATAWWVGQAIPQTAGRPAPAPAASKADAAGDITSLEHLEGLSGDQLMDVFSHGVADIPSATPGSNGTAPLQ